jgi:hypothetical protein
MRFFMLTGFVTDLPAAFCVWLVTSIVADFLRGRLSWANWDVDELLARKDDIVEGDLLNVRLLGWGNYRSRVNLEIPCTH